MLEFDNGGVLIQSIDELPTIPGSINDLFLDFETSSGDPKLDSLNPWFNCTVAGLGITWDKQYSAYYIPIGHHDESSNLDRPTVIEWLREVFRRSKRWVNHNVKYDCHVAYNDLRLDWIEESGGDLICTIVRAKIKDSDRTFRGGYGLDALSLAWLNEDIGQYEHAFAAYLDKNKDYGAVPADIMGEYGCQDVITNRRIHRFLEDTMWEDSSRVIDVETRLTTLLVKMERVGMRVVPDDLRVQRLLCLKRMFDIEQRLHELVGYPFIPTSSKDCYDVLCVHYGLPVVAWTNAKDEDGNKVRGGPSFDKEALTLYSHRIDAPKEVVLLMIEYRQLSTMKGLFLEKYEKLAILDGTREAVLHPSHNQCVRTGRMSVSEPNSQQLNKKAKKLIIPGEGYSFFSSDASQLEFRDIAHYIQDPDIIRAYNENPDVDYHTHVAEMCGIKRRPAKTVNFAIAFGQGRGSTVALLSVDEDVVADILESVEEMVASGDIKEEAKEIAFKSLAVQKGEAIFDTYHDTFPYIRRTAKQAMRACIKKGYVINARGRRRYLPKEHAHKAFNSLNQSLGADIIKERMVAISDELEGTGINCILQVHDELVFRGPTEILHQHQTAVHILSILEDVNDLRVPIRFKYGVSAENWADAAGQELSIPLDEIAEARKEAAEKGWFFHLK